jgi:hypothetical protein
MKKLFLATLLFSATWAATAQGTSAQTTSVQTTTVKMAPVDKSPMDMVYFPDNYPILKIQDKAKDPWWRALSTAARKKPTARCLATW